MSTRIYVSHGFGFVFEVLEVGVQELHKLGKIKVLSA